MTAALIAMLLIYTPPASAQTEGDYLYRVTTMRAAPDKLEALLEWFSSLKASNYYDDAAKPAPFLMRHTQGDQWDLILFTPMKSMQEFYAKKRTERRDRAASTIPAVAVDPGDLIAFAEDLYAFGPPLETFRTAYDGAGFFHIEMFHAAPGQETALLEQRRMENQYLVATGRSPNMIFRRAAGSDVDIFTVGFYPDLQAFAVPAPVDREAREEAAVAAGFEDLDDISFLLRKLIAAHHDTLAVKPE
ncbi:MAG: hypothetical protein ACE5FO_03455 [Parvularculaceae bacterium]